MTAATNPFTRLPPHNFEAEQALLGAILLSNRAYERVSEFLRPEHFADPVHGRIYATCGKLIERGQMANPVTLKTYFESDGGLAEIGGIAYLAQLANAVVSVINAEDYGKLVFDLHLRRELIGLAQDLADAAHDLSDLDQSADRIQEIHEGRLFELASTGATTGGDLKPFGDFVDGALAAWEIAHKRRGAPSGIPTGLRDIDAHLGGMNRSDLLIVAGRPGMGKTSLATTWAVNAARAGFRVAFYSLEMSGQQLSQRIIASHAGIDSGRARMGQLSNDEFERLALAGIEIRDLGLAIDDTPAVTAQAARTRARRLKRRKGLDVIFFDYIGLATPTSGNGNRVHEIESITKGLKALAKELDVPVVALSQLSRAVENREDKRPMLADLRDSGSIEQDADCVLFVYRDEYYAGKAEPTRREGETDRKFNDRREAWEARMASARGMAEVIVAKNRHGREGVVTLAFDGPTTRFSNLARGD